MTSNHKIRVLLASVTSLTIVWMLLLAYNVMSGDSHHRFEQGETTTEDHFEDFALKEWIKSVEKKYERIHGKHKADRTAMAKDDSDFLPPWKDVLSELKGEKYKQKNQSGHRDTTSHDEYTMSDDVVAKIGSAMEPSENEANSSPVLLFKEDITSVDIGARFREPQYTTTIRDDHAMTEYTITAAAPQEMQIHATLERNASDNAHSSAIGENCQLTPPVKNSLPKFPRLSDPRLPRAMNRTELRTFLALLSAFDELCLRNRITYVMHAGTLLGSHMMHSVLPWDDDADLWVKNSHRKRYLKALAKARKYRKQNLYYMPKGIFVKVYFKTSPQAGRYRWKFPFIDTTFYEENSTHVWNINPAQIVILKTDFYPIKRRPLENLWLPAARNPRAMLVKKYHHFFCLRHYWDHKKEVGQSQTKVDCKTLLPSYPFVLREPCGDYVRETLIFNNRSIYSIVVDQPYIKRRNIFYL